MSLPNHLAIIMDGNRRWARENGLPRETDGHREGVARVEDITEEMVRLGIPYLTLYTFSTENFKRSAAELNVLFGLFVEFATKKLKKLQENGVQLRLLGDLRLFPVEVVRAVNDVMAATSGGKKLVMSLCFGYGGRQEILAAVKEMVEERVNPGQINEAELEKRLYSAGLPDVDLVIRTGGAQRISNFMLWKISYAELMFVEKYWPEFGKEELVKALTEYEARERRFGK